MRAAELRRRGQLAGGCGEGARCRWHGGRGRGPMLPGTCWQVARRACACTYVVTNEGRSKSAYGARQPKALASAPAAARCRRHLAPLARKKAASSTGILARAASARSAHKPSPPKVCRDEFGAGRTLTGFEARGCAVVTDTTICLEPELPRVWFAVYAFAVYAASSPGRLALTVPLSTRTLFTLFTRLARLALPAHAPFRTFGAG